MKKSLSLTVGLVIFALATGGQTHPRGAVKEFTRTAQPIEIRLASGQVVTGWGYNGQVPGPEIRVKEGDRVRIVFRNELPVPTSVHWHGVEVPWTMDGPPGVNQKPVGPGETFVYEFVAKPAGTRFYHSHGSGEGAPAPSPAGGHAMPAPAPQPGHGGAPAAPPAMGDAFFMNGRSWPSTEPLKVRKGERVRIRLINAGSMSIHPMHLHGHTFKVIAADGNWLPHGIRRDVVPVTPGERYDIEFVADNPGVWLFHCHELHHMDAGMATLVQYEGFQPVEKAGSESPHGAGMKH